MLKPTNPAVVSSTEFYTYVGLCITAWARVDEALFDILVDVLGTSRALGSIVYYRITMLSGRLGLVDELTSSVLPKPTKKNGGHSHPLMIEWDKLKKEVEDLFRTRTQIAHHPVKSDITFRYKDTGELVPVGIPVPILQATFETSYSIYVSQSELLRGRHEKAKPLTADDLSFHCRAVQEVASKLNRFRGGRLMQHLVSARSKSAPAPEPVRITAGRPKAPQNPPQS